MPETIINDFSFRIATANGTGSMTSNNLIFRALMDMGLATSCKNLFPSNIQGLPTYYQIRVSPQGYQGRKVAWEILLALNPATIDQDLKELSKGSVVIDNSDFKRADENFEGFIRYSVPLDTLARKNIKNAKLRGRLKNMIYVGVVAELFKIPASSLQSAVASVFPKEKIIEINMEAVQIGIDYAKENFTKTDPYELAPADQIGDKIFSEGNEASGLGAIFGGCTILTWYPITPATGIGESVIKNFAKYRVNKDGTNDYAVVQSEDELSAIGGALGAGWAGARAMTSTSGPGISLMSENLGFGYYAELPCVVFNVQRVGPSTGLPTRTQQGDVISTAMLSHGDTYFPMLFPNGCKEAFEFSWRAFDIADRYQVPTFHMTDLDIGMNTWISDPYDFPEEDMDRGKVLSDEELAKLEEWGRYEDVDGDGIPYRTLAGLNKSSRAAFFTRGTGHTEKATYSEDAEVYKRNLDRLARKIQGMGEAMPEPVYGGNSEQSTGLIAYGSSDVAIYEALQESMIDCHYMRIRSFPFHSKVGEFIEQKDRVLVVDQNQNGQMAQLLRLAYPKLSHKIESIALYDGLPLAAETVAQAVSAGKD